jgi:hypothetical protein
MNIQISRLTNGWLLTIAIQTPQGPQQTGLYFATFGEVRKQLEILEDEMNAKQAHLEKEVGEKVIKLPTDRK